MKDQIVSYCEKNSIPVTYTTKLLYRTYSSSVTIKFPFSKPVHPNTGRSWYLLTTFTGTEWNRYCEQNKQYRKKANDFLKEISDLLNQIVPFEDIKKNENSLTIFCNSYDVVNSVLSKLSNYTIGNVRIPRNEKEVELMDENHNKVYRKELFFRKYKYKVTLDINYYSRDSIVDYVFSLFGEERTNAIAALKNENVRFVPHYRILYVNSDEDVTLIKLGISKNIHSIEEVEITKY